MSSRALILVSWFAALAIAPVAASAQGNAGEQQFKQRCAVCHSVAPDGAPGPLAPNLRGVVGRKAGSTVFKTYSPALKASNIVWNAATLDTWLAAPTKLVPGTRKVIAVSEPAQRKAIASYLANLR